MMEWKEVRLGDLCTIKHGFAYKGQYFCDVKTPHILVTPGNFTLSGGFKIDKPKYYNGPIEENYILKEGDLIVTMTDLSKNTDTLGFSALVPSIDGVTFHHNQRIGLVENISPDIDRMYLYWLMRTTNYQRYIANHSSGSTVHHTSPSNIGSYTFLLPPLADQRRIASILSSLDKKIETNNKINANLEKMSQAIFKNWFIDFTPFKDGKFVESELGMIPEGWRVGTIGDYCKVKSGYAFKSSWWTNEGDKVIKIKNISESGALDLTDCACISSENTAKAQNFKAIPGDLIIAMTGATIGKFNVIPRLDGDYYINQRVGKFFLGEEPLHKLPFIYCVLKEDIIINQIINKGQGSAQPNISGSDIENVFIAYNESIIDEFNNKFLSTFETIIRIQQENARLASIRDTLLPRLMSGEIEV